MNKVWACRRTLYSWSMCCIFPYHTKNEQRLYFLTRWGHTWHNCRTFQFKLQLECDIMDMDWYRYTSHSENHSTECEKVFLNCADFCIFKGWQFWYIQGCSAGFTSRPYIPLTGGGGPILSHAACHRWAGGWGGGPLCHSDNLHSIHKFSWAFEIKWTASNWQGALFLYVHVRTRTKCYLVRTRWYIVRTR